MLIIPTGQTALHMAALCGQESCASLLLGAGADPNSQDQQGRTPLHLAVLYKHSGIVKQLLDAEGCDPRIRDYKNRTAMHDAAQVGNLGVLQILVAAHLDPDAKAKGGYTPLDVTKLVGQSHVEWWLRKMPRRVPAVELPSQLMMVSFLSRILC